MCSVIGLRLVTRLFDHCCQTLSHTLVYFQVPSASIRSTGHTSSFQLQRKPVFLIVWRLAGLLSNDAEVAGVAERLADLPAALSSTEAGPTETVDVKLLDTHATVAVPAAACTPRKRHCK
jgi:hypothetical protein